MWDRFRLPRNVRTAGHHTGAALSTHRLADLDDQDDAPERDDPPPEGEPKVPPSAEFVTARERFLVAIQELRKIDSAAARNPAAHAKAIREYDAAKTAFHDASVKY